MNATIPAPVETPEAEAARLELTPAQIEALAKVRARYGHVSKPTPIFFGNGAIGVVVGADEATARLFLGIEKDGYTHS